MAGNDAFVRQCLLAFDRDGDGVVQPNEVVLAKLATGVYQGKEKEEEFVHAVGDKALTYDQASKLILAQTNGKDPKPQLATMFGTFDMKKNGTISAAELKAVLENLSDVLNVAQIDEIINRFGSSAVIKYGELVDFLLA